MYLLYISFTLLKIHRKRTYNLLINAFNLGIIGINIIDTRMYKNLFFANQIVSAVYLDIRYVAVHNVFLLILKLELK